MDLFIIDNLVAEKWCDIQIDKIEDRIINDKRKVFTVHSNSLTDKYTNEEITNELYNKIIQTQKLENCIGPNNFILTSKYLEGGQIGIHTDTLYKEGTEYSKYKALVYLNDNFEGGYTEFYDDKFTKILTVIPKKGKCVIFNMNIYHKGNEIISGNKYILGFEIISKKE
jgi:hypothetical protein